MIPRSAGRRVRDGTAHEVDCARGVPVELTEAVRRRRMVRSYDPDRPVPVAELRRLVALAARAPSAGSAQGWDFLVLAEPEGVARYWAATAPGRRDGSAPDAWLRGMRTAPALVVCWSREDAYRERYAAPDKAAGTHAPADLAERWPVPYWHVDTGMAAMTLLLGAVDAGLGACFFGVPTGRVAALRAAFGVPADRTPVGVVSLGHPAPPPAPPTAGAPGAGGRPGRPGRRPLEEVAHLGRFGAPLR